MPTYKSSVSIEQPPGMVFDYVRDVRNLPRYYDGLTAVEPLAGEAVRVTAETDGRATVAEGWFRVHEGHRKRIEWGSDTPESYHGWMEVDPEGEVCSVTIEVHTDQETGLDERLDRTLYALKTEMEGR